MSVFDQSIFRAYDMRGTYPNQMNEQVAYAVGQAFVEVMGAKNVVVGRDVRSMGPSVEEALIKGVTDAGAHVIQIGIISTEMLYYAAGTLDCDGGMSVTASHNPANWSGIKFIAKDGVALTLDGKLGEVYDFVKSGRKISQFDKGSVTQKNILPAYIQFLKEKFVPADLPNLKVVANVNFGANGKVVDGVVEGLPIEVTRMNWQEDGSFPKGTPDPLLPSNREEILELIKEKNVDFGVAWDADADRAFFYDDRGRFFHGSYITALIIEHFLSKDPQAKVGCERRLTWAVIDAAKNHGKEIVWTLAGHGFIKHTIREEGVTFSGELSGHYFYKDFFYCDNGLISFLVVMGIFAEEIKAGRKVSALLDTYLERYPINPEETNFITDKAEEIINAIAEKYNDANIDRADGVSVEYPNEWRCNLRMSRNEPILRLNLEAKTQEKLAKAKMELIDFIEGFGAKIRDDH